MADDINALTPARKEPQTEDVNALRLTQKVPTVAEIMADLGDAERRAKVRLELAGMYLGRGQPTTALDEVNQALAAKPDLPEAV